MKKHQQEPARTKIDIFHNGKWRGGATCDGYVPMSPEDPTCKLAPLTCQNKDDVMQTIIRPQECSAKPENVICKKKPLIIDEVVTPQQEVAAQPVIIPGPQPTIEPQQKLFQGGV